MSNSEASLRQMLDAQVVSASPVDGITMMGVVIRSDKGCEHIRTGPFVQFI